MPIIYLGLALLISGLILVFYLKTRNLFAMLGWVSGSLERATKIIAFVAATPALCLIVVEIWRGTEPPFALLLGMIFGFGFFQIIVGMLKKEGLLFEKESEAQWRTAQGLPAPSSLRGRITVIISGLLSIAASLYFAV